MAEIDWEIKIPKDEEKEIIEKSIEKIIDRFDFDKVHQVLALIYSTPPPTIFELISIAKGLLWKCAKSESASSGGFTAVNYNNTLELYFTLEHEYVRYVDVYLGLE